jgi:sugar phosphate permease
LGGLACEIIAEVAALSTVQTSASDDTSREDSRNKSRRWLVLALAWMAFLLSYVDRLAWSNVASSMGHGLGLPVAALGVFVTAFYIGYVASNLLGGLASDSVGPRVMLAMALLGLGVSTLAFAFVTSIAAGLVVQALMGLFAGTDYATGVKLIAAWFPRKDRGTAMGIFMTATSLGVVITNLVVPGLLLSMHWTGVYQLLGGLTLAGSAVCFAAVRDTPGGTAEPPFRTADFLELFRSRDLVIVSLSGFGAMWGTWGFAFWASTLMVKARHLSPVEAGGIVAMFGIGAIVSKPLIGVISDYFGGIRKVPVIACLLSFVVILLFFGTLTTKGQFQLIAPVLGVAAFAYSPLLGAMVTEIAGTRRAGSSAGVTNAFWQLGSVIVPVVVGIVFQDTGSFTAAFVALAAGPLLGAIGLMFVHEDLRERS